MDDELLLAQEHILRCEKTIAKLMGENAALKAAKVADGKELRKLRRYYEVKEAWEKRKPWWKVWG